MNSEHFNQVERLFHEALARPRAERPQFLDRACADEQVRREVESLLSSDSDGSGVSMVGEIAGAMAAEWARGNDLVGREVGPYVVQSLIGVGGMGEVYAAEDRALHRRVALKLLPARFSDDLDRRRRLREEARAASALNHPNIITVYHVGDVDGRDYIATEFIDGETLRHRLTAGALPPADALAIAAQVARALDAAHRARVIHRDIKPENIMVRGDGYVKVVDFGLAKLAADERLIGSGGHRLPMGTRVGAIAGTESYMSPEQAAGGPVDHRTDLYSLGLVLHEMLTGARPEGGRVGPLPFDARQRAAARACRDLLARALSIDRTARHQDAASLASDIENVEQLLHPSTGGRRTSRLWAIAAMLLIAVPLVFVMRARRVTPMARDSREAREAPVFTQLTDQPAEELFPALSPDGSEIAYVAPDGPHTRIFLGPVNQRHAVNVSGRVEADDTQPAFSPDGRSLAFRSERDGGGIFLLDRRTGTVRRIADFGFNPSWAPDGRSLLVATESIADPDGRVSISEAWSIEVATGAKRPVEHRGFDIVQPVWSPHQKRIACWSSPEGRRDIWTIAGDGTNPVRVTDDAAVDWNPIWSADGAQLFFLSDRSGSMNLWRVAIDEDTGRVLGPPEPMAIPAAYVSHTTVSRDGGSLAYVQSTRRSNFMRLRFDPARGAAVGAPEWITQGSTRTTNPSVSPDGRWIAFDSEGETREDVFVMRADGREIRKVTDDSFKDRLPMWSPDGGRLAFFSNRSGVRMEIWSTRADGGDPERLTHSEALPGGSNTPIWAPDGERLAFHVGGRTYVMNRRRPWSEQHLSPIAGLSPSTITSWSPDGAWLAGYASNGAPPGILVYDVHRQREERVADFGVHPVWLGDSRRLVFHTDDKIWLVDRITKHVSAVASVASPNRIDRVSVPSDGRAIYFAVSSRAADIWLSKNP